MRITRIHIENFRSIKQLDVELGPTTVFIGPNNAGKTAILDALRIALTRRWGQHGTGFTEYDVHVATDRDDPKASSGVVIEIRSEEAVADEWPDEIQQALDQIVQTDPLTGRNSVTLRVACAWNAAASSYEPSWTFLNVASQPLAGRSARRLNLERFWQFLPVFYLGALRDADDEFSPRSQFWGRLLKAMNIPSALEKRVQRVLNLLNDKLLAADPRLARVAATLTGATQVAARDRAGTVDLRMLPLRSWDLLSKAEIVLRNEPDWPWLPLQRHGQGLQSLSVIFLFQAFVEHLLAELYEPESMPVLALEEPETHLHPQAARSLWAHVNALPGQKVITTHSPYFVQHVPFRDIRIVRLTDKGTQIWSLPESVSAAVPHVQELDQVTAGSAGVLHYDRPSQTLTIRGRINEALYHSILRCYGHHPDRATISGVLRELRDRSKFHISDDELKSLETFARRVRGEIFFARRWLIVEGQSEYFIMHGLARGLGYDLDEHGVSVVDSQNNGNPSIFAALARALGIPWLAVFDGDQQGIRYCNAIKDKDFSDAEVARRCKVLPRGDMEDQLIADGFTDDLRSILQDLGYTDAGDLDPAGLAARLEANKVAYAAALADLLQRDPSLCARMPAACRDAIAELRGLI